MALCHFTPCKVSHPLKWAEHGRKIELRLINFIGFECKIGKAIPNNLSPNRVDFALCIVVSHHTTTYYFLNIRAKTHSFLQKYS